MDEFERARQRTERMREIGRFKPQEHLDKGDKLIQAQERPVLSIPKSSHQKASGQNEIPALMKPKTPGKVRVEVRVYLNDEPMEFAYSTEMRAYILASQLNYRWLSQRFRELFKEFGRVHDIPSGSQ